MNAEINLEEIGERIKYIRLKNGYTQKDFSDKINISLRTLQTYEQGKVEAVPFHTLKKIVDIFDISLEWLFYNNGEIKKNNSNFEDSANMSEINVEGIINRIKIIKSFKFDNELAEYLEITPSALNNFKRRNSLGSFIEKIIHIVHSKDNSLNFNYLLKPIKNISKEKATIQDIDNLQNQIDHLRNLLIEGDKR